MDFKFKIKILSIFCETWNLSLSIFCKTWKLSKFKMLYIYDISNLYIF